MKEQNIMDEDWNNLIILDACRYDSFEKVYKDYLPDGKLERKRSKGSNTVEWLINNFTAKYNITYISSNAFVNSYGIPLNKLNLRCRYAWRATDHFSKIIDVWRFGWDGTLATVHPEEVNRAYLSNKGTNRKIIHYLQPHAPYLSFGLPARVRAREKILPGDKTELGGKARIENKIDELSHRSKTFIGPVVIRILGRMNVWRLEKKFWGLKDKLRMEPATYFEAVWRQGGIGVVQYYYEDNLRKVLESVSHLVSELDGKTVITSDHGESFGEAGFFGHRSETHIPVLIEVPWLVVEKPRKSGAYQMAAERDRVRAKARKLKESGRL